jgi:sigma-E factor negative regulatory protein RseB
MTIFKRFFLSLFLSTGTVSAQDSGLTARQTLTKMNNAMQLLNYQGTIAFFKNDKLETMKYFHAAKDGQEQERLLSLNSPLREVIRSTGKVRCRFNNNRQIVVDHRPYETSFLIDMPKNLDDLTDIYHFELDGEENVAMLPSYVITIKSNDKFRYDRKVWVEKENFLPLKVAVFDSSGTILEQIIFTEQQVMEQLSFDDSNMPDSVESVQQSFQHLPPDQAAFEVPRIPPGFKKVFFNRRPMHNLDQLVDHLVLSDGFASVSVYLENKNPAIPTGFQSAGAINSFSRIRDDYLITVMGEVPAATVKMIAEGVELKHSKSD